ncbi:MAG: cyclin-like protein [Piptocephalis tieghemiana]|nr:MAG: cyclin-like protein [Piptocephalis tieghemiana]
MFSRYAAASPDATVSSDSNPTENRTKPGEVTVRPVSAVPVNAPTTTEGSASLSESSAPPAGPVAESINHASASSDESEEPKSPELGPSASSVPTARPASSSSTTDSASAAPVSAPAATSSTATTTTATTTTDRPSVTAPLTRARTGRVAKPSASSSSSSTAISRSTRSKQAAVVAAVLSNSGATTSTSTSHVPSPAPSPALGPMNPDVNADADFAIRDDVPPWVKLDEEDKHDPTMMSDYAEMINEQNLEREKRTHPDPAYMDQQREITHENRSTLVQWMIAVHDKFRLKAETLYLAVNIVDRFLSLRVAALNKLQLVGIASLFAAAKYQETHAPSVYNYLYMCDHTYTAQQVYQAEIYIYNIIRGDLGHPGPMPFLRRASKADEYCTESRTIAKYLCEIALVHPSLMPYHFSQISAAGMWLARVMLKRGPWDATMVHYTGYQEEELYPIVELFIQHIVDGDHRPQEDDSLYRKYAHRKFLKASPYCRAWARKYPNIQKFFKSSGDA